MKRAVLDLILLAALVTVGLSDLAGQTPQQGTISVTAALVAEELQVRPVALHLLALVKVGDSAGWARACPAIRRVVPLPERG